MYKYAYPLLLLIALTAITACGPVGNRVRFEGTLKGITNAEFYIYSEDGAFDGVDTIRIEDGEFAYERKLDAPAILTLLYPNYTQTYIIAEPGKTIKLKGDASKISEAQISGTEQNELLSDFRIKHSADLEKNQIMAAEQFIRNNAKTLAAVAVYRKYFAQKESPEPEKALSLLDLLLKEQPKERSVSYLNDFYRPIFENGVGQMLPDFEAETLDEKTIRSKELRGKELVIACVGTWESESRPFLKALRKKLKESATPRHCLIVSLDVDRAVLKNNLKNDSINYPVICDRQAFESPLVKQLGLHYVPSLMVVNAQGKILKRDITKIEDVGL